MNLLGELQQLERGALVLARGEGAHQLAQPGAIDIVHISQVQQDALLSLADQVANGIANLYTALAESDPPAEVQNGYAVQFTGSNSKCHGNSSLLVLRL